MPAASQQELRDWFRRGKGKGATHMLVVCDTFDWDDYPVYVMPGEDAKKLAAENSGPNMTKLMEVYDLSLDAETQLNSQTRVFNY